MNLYWIDRAIIVGLLALMVCASFYIKRYQRGVADFLAANRCINRYILGVSEGIASVGAITVVAMFEAYYKSGFSIAWWSQAFLLVTIAIYLSRAGSHIAWRYYWAASSIACIFARGVPESMVASA